MNLVNRNGLEERLPGALRAGASLLIAAFLLAFVVASGAPAREKYPSKPITILVGFEVGSGMDTAARLQGAALSKILGVPVMVRNVPGAGGRNAVAHLHRADPDGYTMAAVNVPGQVVEQLFRGLPSDLRKFVYIGRQVSQVYFLQASKKYAWTSLQGMKKAKEPIKAGITGTAGNTFPISVIAANIVGYPVRFVGGFNPSEVITAIIRGDVEITAMPLLKPYVSAVESGEARPLVVYGPQKHPKWPDIPTGNELGFPALTQSALVGQNLYGLPPGTPARIASTLEEALAKALRDEEVVKKVSAIGNLVTPMSAKEANQLVRDMFRLVEKNAGLLKQHLKK